MIIWLNGAFGSGKSTLAELLHKKLKHSHLYDPEQVGYFLWDNFPKELKCKGDFQDIKIWREFNYKLLRYMNDNYEGILIVPMTIVNIEYYNEIIGNLIKDGIAVSHFILMADKDTIKQRLINRGEPANSWAEQQIDRCLHAFNIINGTKIDTDKLDLIEMVNLIMAEANLNCI
ncbi:MAG: AAA family ATPase [Cellulosilyticaceae bacterium]